MSVFTPKASTQKWTDKFELGHERVSLEDTISPEFYELEREAIFRRTWLYIGRTDQIAEPGHYFTKELEILRTSVLATRDKEGRVRVYYNVCPHRGNKLVWNTHANRESTGHCSRFVCKFHGIGFGLNGRLELLTGRDTWLDQQGSELALAEVPAAEWNGFIFINLTPGGPRQTLKEFLGHAYWDTLSSYPFSDMSERYSMRLDADANWKAMNDGFSEIYHGATTHHLLFPIPNQDPTNPFTFLAAHYAINGPHRQYLYDGHPADPWNFPFEKETRATGVGPRYDFPKDYTKLPEVLNPVGLKSWGTASIMLWPNIFIQWYWPGWYLTYAFWPLAYNKMRFELDIYLPKARNFSELLSQKAGMSMFCEATLQDFSLLEAQQQGLEMRVFENYPLTDEEVLVREYHKRIYSAVTEYQRSLQE